MSLKIQQHERRPCCFDLVLEGRLDTETYKMLEMKLNMLLEGPVKSICYDLSQLEYLSSMGIRVLLRTAKEMKRVGGKLILTNPQPQIRAVIEVANALPSMSLFTSMAEADAYLDHIQKQALAKGD